MKSMKEKFMIEETCYIDSKSEYAALLTASCLKSLLSHFEGRYSELIVLCIGSDRVTGDSLGPLVGSMLKKTNPGNLFIYGTLDSPVHALNLAETLEGIRDFHPGSLCLAVDASLGTKKHQGYITVSQGSLSPGAGVCKNLDVAGDICITGIVGPAGKFSQLTLQTARLSAVFGLAERIAQGISMACCGEAYEAPLTEPAWMPAGTWCDSRKADEFFWA